MSSRPMGAIEQDPSSKREANGLTYPHLSQFYAEERGREDRQPPLTFPPWFRTNISYPRLERRKALVGDQELIPFVLH